MVTTAATATVSTLPLSQGRTATSLTQRAWTRPPPTWAAISTRAALLAATRPLIIKLLPAAHL
eukprot:823746-Pyramimonas_sp.AAC.1